MQNELGENPKDRLGAKKTPLRLVPKIAIAECSLAMADGARKYEAYNWRENSVRYSVYIEAARRHLDLLEAGEDLADDSYCHHAAHAMACMAIILDAMHTGCLVDDRVHSPEAIAALKVISQRAAELSERAEKANGDKQ